MKLLFSILLFTSNMICFAQVENKKNPATLIIEGAVENTLTFTDKNIAEFSTISIDSLQILNHLLEYRRTIYNIKGVLLTDILNKTKVTATSPKLLSEYYFICIAKDGYTVTFSWNELYNTEIGKRVILITSLDGKSIAENDRGFILLSAADKATGRRFVNQLEKIIVKQATK